MVVEHPAKQGIGTMKATPDASLSQSGVGVEKVTSISRMRLGRSMLEESIRPCSV